MNTENQSSSQVIPFPKSRRQKPSFWQRWFKVESTKTAKTIAPQPKRDTVLVVDDDPVTGILVCSQVRKHGRQAILAKNAEEAWRILRQKPIKAVISDYFMPGMDGIDLAKKMRQTLGEFKETSLIFLTACEDEKTFINALYAGADMYLNKPVNAAKLDACLVACNRKYQYPYSDNNHLEPALQVA